MPAPLLPARAPYTFQLLPSSQPLRLASSSGTLRRVKPPPPPACASERSVVSELFSDEKAELRPSARRPSFWKLERGSTAAICCSTS